MYRPNFTGTWKFSPSRSVLQIAPPDSTIFVVEHAEPTFCLSRAHVIGKTSDTFTIELTTDGKEVVVDRDELHIRAHATGKEIHWSLIPMLSGAKTWARISCGISLPIHHTCWLPRNGCEAIAWTTTTDGCWSGSNQ
jgi:hypothetical protein